MVSLMDMDLDLDSFPNSAIFPEVVKHAINVDETSAITTQGNDDVLIDLDTMGEQADAEPIAGSSTIQEIDMGVEEESEEELDVEEEEDDEEQALHPREWGTQHKRQIQKAKLDAWFTDYVSTVTEEDLKKAVKATDDSHLSVQNLIAKQDFATIINNPREYQIELFEKAKEENLIAVLDTGSGKTMIAVLLLKHVLEQELTDRMANKPHKTAFFLVHSVTLVFQQAAVLECNTDYSIGKFCGAMGTDLWDREVWKGHFDKHMAIVCTAEVLHQCLMHGFISMKQINLLIFDEAHHTKKDHPYARIIKDFYLKEEDTTQRPRIFGMTASPVDAKIDPREAANTLEALLDSKICTASNLKLLQQTVSRPTEEVWIYDRLSRGPPTMLFNILKKDFLELDVLRSLFRYAKEAALYLGPWAADHVWSFSLTDTEVPKMEGKAQKDFAKQNHSVDPAVLETVLEKIRAAREVVRNHIFQKPRPTREYLSLKTLSLYEGLEKYFERNTDTKCIVFCQQRHTARILCDLFTEIGSRHLRPGILIGIRSTEAGDLKTSFRQQVLTLAKFRTGELNCLFATSVAEEGLDIPDCNLIVRFDLYATLIQYIQSRGRARHANSTFIHMLEKDNGEHRQIVQEVHEAETVMQKFCSGLDQDRLLEGNAIELRELIDRDRGRNFRLTIPGTNATLTYGSSLAILAHFADSLQYEHETSTQVTYIISRAQKQFVCEVILPEKSPFRGLVGKPCARKMDAKRYSAFKACIMLHQMGLLDDNLMSTYHRRLPEMRNAQISIKGHAMTDYPRIIKPTLWEEGWGKLPKELFITIIRLVPSKPLQRKYSDLALLTRERLPRFPQFPLFLEDDVETMVHCENIDRPLLTTTGKLELLNHFVFRAFQDCFNKFYEHEPQNLSYWLAPVDHKLSEQNPASVPPETVIDWGLLQTSREQETIPWSKSSQSTEDRFFIDGWSGEYRYFSFGVTAGVKPSDPVPPEYKKKKAANLMEYSLSAFKNSKAKILPNVDWNGPVLSSKLVPLSRNYLDRRSERERNMHLDYLICPQVLEISAIPPKLAASIYTFPAILSRLESYLIAAEACQRLDLGLELGIALEALTKDSNNTDDSRQQQIQFQRGMGKNYERLEFLGDCYLKMGTSISLFAQNPDNDEFDFHVKRMLLICNKNLFNTALELQIPAYVRSKGFNRSTWYPDNLSLKKGRENQKDKEKASFHGLGDKTIADVCEALIGASLLSGGFDMAAKAVTAFVRSEDHNQMCWEDYRAVYSIPEYQLQQANARELLLARSVEERLHYHFKYPRLLHSAFTHPSYPSKWSRVPSYQRLEFLGDSLLDMVCINHLYDRYPDRDPQWLTEHKMAMVSNKFLGFVSVKMGFNKHLESLSSALQAQITRYVEEVEAAEAELEHMEPGTWTTLSEGPKCLPDMLEAYIGAIFVDSNFNFKVVEDFFNENLAWFFEDMSIYDTFANKHPTTYLHNRLTIDFGCENYTLRARELPGIDGAPPRVVAVVLVHEEVIATGQASSGRYAKLKASEKALKALEAIPAFKFREKFGCDCSLQEKKNDEEEAELQGTGI